jgi:hypothetical protein
MWANPFILFYAFGVCFFDFLYRRTKKLVSPLKTPSKFNPKRFSTNKPSKTILFECAPPPLFLHFPIPKKSPAQSQFLLFPFFLEWIFHFGLLRVRALPKVKNLKKLYPKIFGIFFCFSILFKKNFYL